MEQVYYYRWKLYKAHLRNVGKDQFVTTEFINDMGWDIDPYSTINAATMHHIYEGRWLKDDRYMNGYINYMYRNGGNNRQYSESIADAAYARYLVNGDSSFIMGHLDSMKASYMGWSDHYDSSKQLYYIPAMPDATEYTIASIDASGGKDGFAGGEAFRPTINSYMYGNAMAIARIAAMRGDKTTSEEYARRAALLKQRVQEGLWNDSLTHFTDRYQVTNQFVHYWDFIRGRELAGMAPWYFDLPDDSEKFNAAWRHAIDTAGLLGKYGFRTNEPSYQYYFTQFTYSFGQPGSQWNGPSWPYQSSQALTAMANFLNDYSRHSLTPSDYLHSLRLFTQQHYLPDGKINLVENYNPDKGGPIVYYYWSNHYLHSTYNNLIISGLCGIRPSSGDSLTIHPLIDSSIHYFMLDDLRYHGHKLTVLYDEDGTRYNAGKGVAVFVDGKRAEATADKGRYRVHIGATITNAPTAQPENIALNIRKAGVPVPIASANGVPDSLFQAIDGKIWYFPEITNGWTTKGSTSSEDWYALDFKQNRDISSVNLYFYSDKKTFAVPDTLYLEYEQNGKWLSVKPTTKGVVPLKPNTRNSFQFEKASATSIRIRMKHSKIVSLVEFEVY